MQPLISAAGNGSGGAPAGRRMLLISCYELGHQPLHIASATAFLRNAGHDVRAIDLSVCAFDDAAVEWAEMVAIAVPMHTAMRIAAGVAARIRRLRSDGVTVIVYGLYGPLCGSVLDRGLVDHAIGGEFEEELVRIASGTPSGRTLILDRLAFPVPARDLLPGLEQYARLLIGDEERLAGYVEASRGCVHRCRHCPVPAVYDGRMRIVQREAMVADVAQLHALGARHLTFGDPDFLNAVPHALAAARAVHERFPELTFDITTKIEHILAHRSIWAEMEQLGLIFVVSAVESTSARVLSILDKGHTHADTLEAIALVRAHGIDIRPSLLPFTPWTSLDEYLTLLDFIVDADLMDSVDPVQLTIRLLVPEGSLLLQRHELRAHLHGYDSDTFSHVWRHPDPAVDELQRRLSALVAADTDAGVDAATTHSRIRDTAAAAALVSGVRWDPRTQVGSEATTRPRLSEPWFCCAEPTDRQLGGL